MKLSKFIEKAIEITKECGFKGDILKAIFGRKSSKYAIIHVKEFAHYLETRLRTSPIGDDFMIYVNDIKKKSEKER